MIEKLTKAVFSIGIAVVSVTVFVGVFYLCWMGARKLNYQFAYNSQVEETVRKMVKPECLKDEYKQKGK